MILIKGNVERVSENPAVIEQLKREGYKVLDEKEDAQAKTEKPDLTSLTVVELKELAKEKGLTGCSVLNKEQLLEVLKDVV